MSDSFLPHGQVSLSITNSWSLLKLMSIKSVMPSNHLVLCFPLLLLPSIFPSIRVFSNESVLHFKWPKYWSFGFSFSISPSNEYSGLISFRIDWFDLFEIQGTLWKGKKQVMVHISCCQRRIDDSRLCCKWFNVLWDLPWKWHLESLIYNTKSIASSYRVV